jgi:DivIVA domain-containing protein
MGPDPSLTPELIQAQSFTASFRGFDQTEVRTFLNRVAAEIRTLRERTSHLESAWHSAEERAARPPVLDEDTLMSAVGEETAAILRTARAAATDLKTKAAEEAERTLTDANARAGEINEEAQGVLGRQTKAAEEAAGRIVEGARSEAAGVLERARIEADTIRAKAEQERALTIEGASSTRDRILEDLSRRRRVATVQIEQLRAGRERLIESYAVVRRTLEEAQQELGRADAEARAAADEVGRRLRREHDLRPDDSHEFEPDSGAAPPTPDMPAADMPAPFEAGSATDASGGVDPSGGAGPATVAVPVLGPDTPDEVPEEASPTEDKSQAPTDQADTAPTKSQVSAPAPGRGGGRRRGPFGRARGSNVVAVTAEHPAALASVAPDPSSSDSSVPDAPTGEAGPHLRLVPDDTPTAGNAVDELFARIRAGRSEADAEESSTGESSATETIEGAPVGETAEGETAGGQATGGRAATALEAGEAEGEEMSDGDEALLQRRESEIVDLEVTLTRKLKRALQDEQNDLLDRLRSLRGEPTASTLLPEHQAQVARYVDAASPLLEKASAAGAAFTAEILELKPANRGSASVGEVANEAARSIVDPLRRRLEEVINAHIGEDQSVLVESLGAAYREWKSQRIERIAGDALAGAFSRGTWHAMPEGTSMRWIVEDADGPCPDCDDDALAGVLPRNEAFPTGQHYPPAHSGCRCLLVPSQS